MFEEEILAHVPGVGTDEIREYAIEYALLQSRYIFINKDNVKNGYCSHCKSNFEIANLKHNSKVTCPNCKSECTVKQTRYGRGSLVDRACFIYYDKSIKDKNSIIATGVYAERDYSQSYLDVKTRINIIAYYVFTPKEAAMIRKDWYSSTEAIHWIKTNSIYSFNINSLAKFPYSISYESIEKAVKDTPFQYSMWEEYIGSDMLKYFSFYSKHPIVEQLTKVGLKRLVKDQLDSSEYCYRAVNWRAKDIYKALKMQRKDLKEIRAAEVNVSPLFLKLYQINSKDNSKLTPGEVKVIEYHVQHSFHRLEEILKHTTLRKAYRYILKQEPNLQSLYSNIISTWADYISDCIKLGIDLKDKSNLYPKNLITAHQNTIKQIKIQEDKTLDSRIEQRLKSLQKYCFENKSFILRPVANSKELVEEGKQLHHCVGRYAKQYSSGETNIFVIRDKSNIEKPFYTMEIKNNRIVQVHGSYNCGPTKIVEKFIEAFKKRKLQADEKQLTA